MILILHNDSVVFLSKCPATNFALASTQRRSEAMQQVQQLVERYVAVWNETDPAARRRAIEQLWTPDGEHYVKTTEVRGHDALERRIRDSHDKNVARGGNRFRAACNIQELRDVVTFNWEMIR